MDKFAVILAAAGKSTRFGANQEKKVFVNINAKPVWMHAAEKFCGRSDVGQILIVISPEDSEFFKERYAGDLTQLGIEPVLGGAERADSVRNGIACIREEMEYVAIHDAARPCLTTQDIDLVFQQAQRSGAALLASPCAATIKRANEKREIVETISRQGVWLAQTPQVFRTELLKQAYAAHPNPSQATDEASLVEALGKPVTVVEGNPLNIKVTTKADLKFVELALKSIQEI